MSRQEFTEENAMIRSESDPCASPQATKWAVYLSARIVSEGARLAAATAVLVTTLALGVLFAPAAIAGAATGMPSPFVPPYPDFGFCAPCPAGCRCAPVARYAFAHQRVPLRTVAKDRRTH
jgi:hypothetical protein